MTTPEEWSVNELIQVLLAVAAIACGALGQWNRIRIGQLELQNAQRAAADKEKE